MRLPHRLEHTLDAALDKALAVEKPIVHAYLDRARSKDPHLRPDELVQRLDRRYLATVTGIGGASGAAAAVPGAGTVASVASGAAEITAFVSATALYVLALAEIHDVRVQDPQARRALVVSVLVGEGGAEVIAGNLAGKAAKNAHWAKVLGRTTAKDEPKLAGLNTRLGRLLVTRFGARQGALLFGRALPLGIGAGVGALGNAALARGVITTARRAFGPPPTTLPPRVIDVP